MIKKLLKWLDGDAERTHCKFCDEPLDEPGGHCAMFLGCGICEECITAIKGAEK